MGEAVGGGVSVGTTGPRPASKSAPSPSTVSSALTVASGLRDGARAAAGVGLVAPALAGPPTVGELVCGGEPDDTDVDGDVDGEVDVLPLTVGLAEPVAVPVGDPLGAPPGVVQLGVVCGCVPPLRPDSGPVLPPELPLE